MKRIAYLGKIQLSDTDLPYLHEAQQMADVTNIMEVNPRFLTGPAFNIKTIFPNTGLFKATDIYPEFSRLQGFVDLDKFYVLNTTGRYWMLKSFYTYYILLRFLIRGNYDVIHLTWPPNIYEFLPYILRKKMVLTVHDPIPHSSLDTRIVRLRRWFAFRLIPRFILYNKAQRQQFISRYKLSPEQVLVSRMSCCTYLQLLGGERKETPPYILFAGKISPYKGLDYLLPAIVEAHRRHPDIRLVVAGGGKYHFDITPYQRLDYIDIRNHFIPDSELAALIQNSTFMVCPYTDATQSGVIMSAFAFNKPVIATNVGGLPEMVRNQHYGLIIKEKDTTALADAITHLWENPDITAAYSEEIRRDYSTGDLSWRKTAQEIINWLK